MTDAQSSSGQTDKLVWPAETEQLPPLDPPQANTAPASDPLPDPQEEAPMETDTVESRGTASSERETEEEFDYPAPPQSEQVVLEWQAPNRPFKKRNRQYYTTVGVIVFLISLILFFAGQFLPIAVVIAVAFLAYVLSAVPPEIVRNRVTTYGIRSEGNLHYWEDLGRFWLSTKYGQRLIHIETSKFPNQITLVLGDQDETELVEILSEVLLYEKPPSTTFERAAQWLQEKIPLDTEA